MKKGDIVKWNGWLNYYSSYMAYPSIHAFLHGCSGEEPDPFFIGKDEMCLVLDIDIARYSIDDKYDNGEGWPVIKIFGLRSRRVGWIQKSFFSVASS